MANKHLPHDLKQMQSLPLEAKIITTQQRIRQWYEDAEPDFKFQFYTDREPERFDEVIKFLEGILEGEENVE